MGLEPYIQYNVWQEKELGYCGCHKSWSSISCLQVRFCITVCVKPFIYLLSGCVEGCYKWDGQFRHVSYWRRWFCGVSKSLMQLKNACRMETESDAEARMCRSEPDLLNHLKTISIFYTWEHNWEYVDFSVLSGGSYCSVVFSTFDPSEHGALVSFRTGAEFKMMLTWTSRLTQHKLGTRKILGIGKWLVWCWPLPIGLYKCGC